LFINVTKPALDIVLFSKKLAELVGWHGPGCVFGWYSFTGLIISLISPAFGKMAAVEQTIEGEYRAKHTDLITHSEEIAFYNGSDWEKRKINEKFMELLNHKRFVLYKKFLMAVFDYIIVKYGTATVGYAVVGLPVFGPGREEYLKSIGNDSSKITNDYVRNSSLLINLAKAIGRIVISYKDIQSLAGYTTLISELDDVLKDLRNGKYRRTQVVK